MSAFGECLILRNLQILTMFLLHLQSEPSIFPRIRRITDDGEELKEMEEDVVMNGGVSMNGGGSTHSPEVRKFRGVNGVSTFVL